MGTRHIHIHLFPSNMQTGWCDHCNLPSRITYDVVTVGEHGVSTLGYGVTCTDCDPEVSDA